MTKGSQNSRSFVMLKHCFRIVKSKLWSNCLENIAQVQFDRHNVRCAKKVRSEIPRPNIAFIWTRTRPTVEHTVNKIELCNDLSMNCISKWTILRVKNSHDPKAHVWIIMLPDYLSYLAGSCCLWHWAAYRRKLIFWFVLSLNTRQWGEFRLGDPWLC